MIDITNEDAVLVSGVPFPTALLRAIAQASTNRIRIETDDGTVEEIEVVRTGPALSFTRHPRSGPGSDTRPSFTEFRAELVSPDKKSRQWVSRGEAEDNQLRSEGWIEAGKTRPRPVPVSGFDTANAGGTTTSMTGNPDGKGGPK